MKIVEDLAERKINKIMWNYIPYIRGESNKFPDCFLYRHLKLS